MTAISYEPERLKLLRKARKIGRPKLAKLTGLTQRQLTRLETAPKADLMPVTTLHLIADALQVPEGVLTGDVEITDMDLMPATKSTCTSGCCS